MKWQTDIMIVYIIIFSTDDREISTRITTDEEHKIGLDIIFLQFPYYASCADAMIKIENISTSTGIS